MLLEGVLLGAAGGGAEGHSGLHGHGKQLSFSPLPLSARFRAATKLERLSLSASLALRAGHTPSLPWSRLLFSPGKCLGLVAKVAPLQQSQKPLSYTKYCNKNRKLLESVVDTQNTRNGEMVCTHISENTALAHRTGPRAWSQGFGSGGTERPKRFSREATQAFQDLPRGIA